VVSAVEIARKRIDLAIGQSEAIKKCELVVGRGSLAAVGESELDGVTDKGMLRVLVTCLYVRLLQVEVTNRFSSPSFPFLRGLFWFGTGTTTRPKKSSLSGSDI